MAHKKGAGSTRNLQDSNPKYLGMKVGAGEQVASGQVLLRQRGTKLQAGRNVGIGKDHTLFALANGTVRLTSGRKKRFDDKLVKKKYVNVQESAS